MLASTRVGSLVATATTALLIAALVPASPAFADGEEPTTLGSIAGVVSDPTGFPAAGSCVSAELFDGSAWVELSTVIEADATGAYNFTDLEPGMYTVSAAPCAAPSDSLRTWAPSLDAPPLIVDGSAGAEAITVEADADPAIADIRLLPAPVEAIDGPTVSGAAIVGSPLTADAGLWSVGTVVFSYQWLRNGAPVSGATDQTYTPTIDDVDAVLSVEVFATRDGWAEGRSTSAATTVVPKLPLTAGTPTITGSAKVGQTLTATAGTWAPASTVASFAWLRDGSPIVGATAKTYKLTAADFDKKISIRVTGTSTGYATASKVSTSTAKVAAGSLVTPAPKVTGTVKVGQTLTAATGWTPSGITYTYQWKRNGATIAGATKATYAPTADDLGKKLTVTVKGTLAGYTAVTLTSASTAAVAIGTFSAPAPTVSGTVAVGRTVTAVPGAWKPGASFSYLWKRNGVAIAGATKSTYAITTAEYGKTISVTVTGKKTAYTTATKTSVAFKVAAGALTAPVPTISGTRAVGKTLTAVSGTWKPTGVALSYQWKRNGAAIKGATKSTFVLGASDLGKTITVTVTGKKAAYATTGKTSAVTGKIAAGALTAAAPTISGTRAVGKTLTAVTGTWKPSGVAFSYQWKRAGTAISGATKSTYALTAADLGKTITVTVTGKKAGYTNAAKTSGATGKIAAGALSLKAGVSGTAKVGSTLTATASATAGVALSYQWYRAGTKIGGATGRTYNPSNADIGKTLVVAVTARKSGYTTLTSRSGATAAVRPPDRYTPTGSGWRVCPSWAPIKGNQSGIYHVPGGAYYDRTNPEECFSSEAAAMKAGYRRSLR